VYSFEMIASVSNQTEDYPKKRRDNMKGLRIEFDVSRGDGGGRPDGVRAKDPALQCYGWQDLDSTPQVEIRIIEDDRDISQFEGREAEGVKVLYTDEEIQTEIDKLPTRCSIDSPELFQADIQKKGINLNTLKGKTSGEQIAELHALGVKGIRKSVRPSLAQIYRR